MARFDKYLTPATNLASRMVSLQLRRQAPVRSGRLKNSVRVSTDRNRDGFIFTTTYEGYGIFTDLGTGKYGVSEAQRGDWNPTPGKGKGGIKPRFWLSLDTIFMNSISDIYEEALLKSVEEEINDKFNEI